MRGTALLFAGMLLLALWVLTRHWNLPILDRHDFRQLQTALSTYWLRADGLRLAYPLPLFGPPWSAPLEFPLYQACVASLSGTFHLPLEQTGRAVGIAFFLATLPALYGLLGLFGAPPPRRFTVLTAVILTPVYLFYTRTFMIESTALCLSAWFLFGYLRSLRDQGWRWLVMAVALGVLAALVKITTFAVFCIPAAGCALCELWRQRHGPGSKVARLGLRASLPALAALGVAAWWVHFSDAIKQSNPFSAFLTSSHLSSFNFGSVAERLDPAFWSSIGESFTSDVLSESTMALTLLGLCLVDRRDRRVALLTAAVALGGPLIFSPLFFFHDYYFYANALFLTGAAGWVLAALLDSSRLPRTARIVLPLLFFGTQLLAFNRSGYAASYRGQPPRPPELAALVQAVVPPGDVVLILGWDWNSRLPYYAQRRAIMVPLQHEEDTAGLDEIAARLPPRQIAAVIWKGPGEPPAPFAHWCAARLKLATIPVAESADGNLYLPAAEVPAAARILAGRTFATVQLNPGLVPDALETMMHEETFRPETFVGPARPPPFKARSLHGIGVNPTLIIAHAPSELHFAMPPGASRLQAGFAMDPQSYSKANQTDGVEVEIYEQQSGGLRRRLYQRLLRPATEAGDRGPQTVELTGLKIPDGILVLRVSPGPAGNAAYDWFYWTRITID